MHSQLSRATHTCQPGLALGCSTGLPSLTWNPFKGEAKDSYSSSAGNEMTSATKLHPSSLHA